MNDLEKEIMYRVVDLFASGIPAAEIAESVRDLNTMEVMEILQSDAARDYLDKIRALRKMELDALADGPALTAVRTGLKSSIDKDALHAADMTWKASGKYAAEQSTVATLAEILKRVMDDAKKPDNST